MRHSPRIFLGFLLALAGCQPASDSEESLGGKSEWSVLQAAHYNTRHLEVTRPHFTAQSGYVLLVLPGPERASRVLIMLRSKHSPLYKHFPQVEYQVPHHVLNIVVGHGLASSAVEDALRSRVAR